MTQTRIPFRRRRIPKPTPANVGKVRDAYRVSNQQAAAVILQDVQRHGGENSLAVRWARATLTPR